MVKKLKGKATKELKGEEKRKREREFEKASDFCSKLLPIILLVIILLSVLFFYLAN